MFAINPSSDPRGNNACQCAAAQDALGDAVDWAYGGVAMARSRQTIRSASTGPRVGLCEVLADPIVQALMTADGTDRGSVAAMMRDVAARLATSGMLPASCDCVNNGASQ
jgi:hypothetical protein